MTRQEAMALGLMTYENGNPCVHGYVAPRYTKKGGCVPCENKRNAVWDLARRRVNKLANPARYSQIWRRYRATDKGKATRADWAARCRAKNRPRIAPWADVKRIREIYAEARRLGLSVDHIIPLNGKKVCGLHVETNLQLMPLIENMRKNNSFEVSCPGL